MDKPQWIRIEIRNVLLTKMHFKIGFTNIYPYCPELNVLNLFHAGRYFSSPTFQSSWFKRSEVRLCEQKYLPGWMTCCPTISLLEAVLSLQWRHNGHDSVSNHQPHDCLLNRLFRRRSKKHQSAASLAFVRGIHRDRWIPRTNGHNAENVSIWWRHHVFWIFCIVLRVVTIIPVWRCLAKWGCVFKHCRRYLKVEL